MSESFGPSGEVKVLALDVSTKTGWAEFCNGKLSGWGLIRLPKKVAEYGEYPWSYLEAARSLADMVRTKVIISQPDVIVIEETNGSRSRYTQKVLEFLHCQLLEVFSNLSRKRDVKYVNSSEWRKVIGMGLTKEQKKANATLSKATRNANGGKIDKAALGIKGKITKKHLSVAYANSTYNLTLKVKDNDIADAICLGTAYVKGAQVCDGK